MSRFCAGTGKRLPTGSAPGPGSGLEPPTGNCRSAESTPEHRRCWSSGEKLHMTFSVGVPKDLAGLVAAIGSRRSHSLHVWSKEQVANTWGERCAKRTMLMKFWWSPRNMLMRLPVTKSYKAMSTLKPLVMRKSSVQFTDSDDSFGKGSKFLVSRKPGLLSSYLSTHVVPDWEAPQTAHCGLVRSHERPNIGKVSTSVECVQVSVLPSSTVTNPSFLPISRVPGRVGWNSNWRAPLLDSSSFRACGTCCPTGASVTRRRRNNVAVWCNASSGSASPAGDAAASQPVPGSGHLLPSGAKETPEGPEELPDDGGQNCGAAAGDEPPCAVSRRRLRFVDGGTHGRSALRENKVTPPCAPLCVALAHNSCSLADAGNSAKLRRSPCVQRRSARRRMPPCTESSGPKGLCRLAGSTVQDRRGSHMPRLGNCFCSSWQRSSSVILPAGLPAPTCRKREAPGPCCSSVDCNSTTQP
mmetsp:Transcript_7326/g.19034  ORF Transcript_7326/g.19034 Transcript_7326/m.19034 type:complete len:469 (+) Transcript_7326:194-1600(+)